MYSSLSIGHSLAKRFIDEPPKQVDGKFPAVALVFFLLDFILFIPVLVIIGYSLGYVYPTLAAVEDPLPAYDALSMNDDGMPKDDNEPVRTALPGKPITGSLRAINRLICSLGNWRSNFRGLGYGIVVAIIGGATTLFLSLPPFIPNSIAQLLALIIIAPLFTTWTHFVITAPPTTAGTGFFKRIPPFRKVYLATWFPTFLFWAAMHASVVLPTLLAHVIGLQEIIDPSVQPGEPGQPGRKPMTGSDIAKVVCVLGVHLALNVLLVTPAHVALTRVQASLLPADQDTLVPFDRSFGGRVEPEVVSGKGFATFGAALKTVSSRSWLRIYLLDVKVFLVSMAAYIAMGAIVAVQVLLLGVWAMTTAK